MKKFAGPIDFEKYYGEKKYQPLQIGLTKKYFSKEERILMLSDILEYINDNNYTLYHDFMDDISEKRQDWFNFLTFDKRNNKCIVFYIKSKAQTLLRNNK